MKKIVLIVFTMLLINTCFSQDNPRPTKSRFWKSKFSTFSIKPGDILVYNVEANGETYNMVAYVKKFGNTISFDLEVPQKGSKTSIELPATAVKEATKYSNLHSAASANNTLWLSRKNYIELAADGVTRMDFGSGPQEFIRGNAGVIKINFKGKEKILTLYNVSTQEGEKKNVGVLTEENNPLIVTMDSGIKMTLKEVR